MIVNPGLVPGLGAVNSGSGLVGAVDGVDLAGLGGSQLSAGIAVDLGVDHHVAGSQLALAVVDDLGGGGDLVDGIAVGHLHASHIQAAGSIDDAHGVDGLEDVVGHAVVVVVNDLQAVAALVLGDLSLVFLDIQVLGGEVLPLHGVGDIAGAVDHDQLAVLNGDKAVAERGGTHIHFAQDVVADSVVNAVGSGEDGADVLVIGLGQLGEGVDDLAVLIGVVIVDAIQGVAVGGDGGIPIGIDGAGVGDQFLIDAFFINGV